MPGALHIPEPLWRVHAYMKEYVYFYHASIVESQIQPEDAHHYFDTINLNIAFYKVGVQCSFFISAQSRDIQP
jgi:hypothetical protein